MTKGQIGIIGISLFISACGSASSHHSDSEQNVAAAGPLNPRIQMQGLSLEVKSLSASPDEDKFNWSGLRFRYLVSAEPPRGPVSKEPLQTTSFDLFKDLAVATSMMAGERVEGAVDIIHLSGRDYADILGTLLFKDTEFTDVKVRETVAFAVGASMGEHDGAVMVVIDYSDPKNPREIARTALGGFIATSISLNEERTQASIISGDNGGLSVVDIRNPFEPRIITELSLPQAISAVSIERRHLILGSRGFIWETDGLMSEAGDWGSSEIFAPARMSVQGAYLLTNANASGLTLFDHLSDRSLLTRISHTPLPGTGNGIDALYRYALLAQGESGLLLADIKRKEAPEVLGSIDFKDDRGSANNVRYGIMNDVPVAFLADGLGGFRVLALVMDTSLYASKTYSPSAFQDDVNYVNVPTLFRIPAFLPVTSGNAGNHRAFLRFDDVVCTYQGGSSQSRPSLGTTQWNLGLRYNFVSCTNGAVAGQSIRAQDEVGLQVNNGHSGFSPTSASVNLEVIRIDP